MERTVLITSSSKNLSKVILALQATAAQAVAVRESYGEIRYEKPAKQKAQWKRELRGRR